MEAEYRMGVVRGSRKPPGLDSPWPWRCIEVTSGPQAALSAQLQPGRIDLG
jgi:hypothetical protein